MWEEIPIRFRVVSIPWPETQEPDFVKEAYVGLILESWAIMDYPNKEGEPFDVYMVHLPNLLRAMAAHDYRAYQYLVAQWGDIQKIVEPATTHPISLPFPVYCCEVASDKVH